MFRVPPVFPRFSRRPARSHAFTLIELLIVVAIIAILAAIALPNFLEAQVRAKVSRTRSDLRTMNTGIMAYVVDYNRPFPDTNDSTTFPDLDGWTFQVENPGLQPDVGFRDPGLSQYYTFGVFRPLTTPVAYMTSVPRDPFSRVMPLGYDTREVDGRVAYCAMFSCGPDRVEGDWFRGCTDTGMAITYDATNGTTSRGDLWRAMVLGDSGLFATEYGPEQ